MSDKEAGPLSSLVWHHDNQQHPSRRHCPRSAAATRSGIRPPCSPSGPCRDIGPGQLPSRGGPAAAGQAPGPAGIQGARVGLAGQPGGDRGAQRARRQPVQEPAET